MNIFENVLDYITDYKYGVFNSWWWKDFWYHQISSRINPRNKWLTKKIPRTWVDKDTIMEIAIIECLKHYVDPEGEDCFNALCTTNPPEQASFLKEVRHYYDLTKKIEAMEKELETLWDNVPMTDISAVNVTKLDYEERYGKIDRLEAEIRDLQTEIMVWIIRNRASLWT